jgi:NADH-quinone oxidoreductase subunit M
VRRFIVAYSSVCLGFMTLSVFFLFNDLAGVSGGIVQMIAHGFVSAAMFLCIVLYDHCAFMNYKLWWRR